MASSWQSTKVDRVDVVQAIPYPSVLTGTLISQILRIMWTDGLHLPPSQENHPWLTESTFPEFAWEGAMPPVCVVRKWPHFRTLKGYEIPAPSFNMANTAIKWMLQHLEGQAKARLPWDHILSPSFLLCILLPSVPYCFIPEENIFHKHMHPNPCVRLCL